MASIVSFWHVAGPRVEPATSTPLPAPAPFPAASGRLFIRSAVGLVRGAFTRRELRGLTDRQLRDIGLDRFDVEDPLEASQRVLRDGRSGR